jgi:hypothetical protein
MTNTRSVAVVVVVPLYRQPIEILQIYSDFLRVYSMHVQQYK